MKTNFALVVFFALPLTGVASTTPDPAVLAKATSLLNHADEVLGSSSSLVAKYTQTDAYSTPYRDLRQEGTVSFVRPGELRLEIVRARRVLPTDPWKDTGNNTLAVSGPNGQFSVFFHPHSTQVHRVEPASNPAIPEVPALNGFFAGTNTPASILRRVSADGKLDDIQVDGNDVRFSQGTIERSVEVGSDGLIHQYVVRDQKTGETHTWKLDRVTVNTAVPAKEFRYTPPADALPYGKGASGDPLEIGETAPDFTVPDYAGKPVQLHDLRGKVVVLKFWATWCWPCNQSLPETEALAATYRDQGVETIAVAIKDSKTGFDAWVKKHPSYRDVRFAFEDPNHPTVSVAFQVRTQPTVFVIDRAGKIVAEIEGFTGPNPALENAIKTALAH